MIPESFCPGRAPGEVEESARNPSAVYWLTVVLVLFILSAVLVRAANPKLSHLPHGSLQDTCVVCRFFFLCHIKLKCKLLGNKKLSLFFGFIINVSPTSDFERNFLYLFHFKNNFCFFGKFFVFYHLKFRPLMGQLWLNRT